MASQIQAAGTGEAPGTGRVLAFDIARVGVHLVEEQEPRRH